MRAIAFIVRGCPAGWLGAYGNEWVGTPNLDRVAAEAVVFDRHTSDRPDPAAASAAWLGRERPNPPTPFPPREGGVLSPSPDGGGVGEGLLQALRAAGVRTVLVRANHPDTDGPGWFYAGWGEVFDARPQEEDHSPLDALIRSLPDLLDRLAAVPDFLLWVETDRLLPPWDVRPDVFEAYFLDEDDEDDEEQPKAQADEDDGDDGDDEEDEDEETGDEDVEDEAEAEPVGSQSQITNHKSQIPPWSDPPTGPFDGSDPEAREWLHCSFAAVATSLDAELGKVFDQLRGRGLDQSAAWLVTSDLGYPLGEHGQIGPHRPWLYEELVHLPLILRLPDAAEEGRRVRGFTQPPDLAPTLLALFGLKPPEGLAGFSLLPLARGEAESVREHAITSLELNGAAEAAIRTDDWALLLPTRLPDGETREPQLYGKPDDRWEVNDLRRGNIKRADELEAEIKSLAADQRR